MLKNLDNPNFERPQRVLQENTRFSVEQKRFYGPKSYDGFVGGAPLAYDRESGMVAVDSSDNHTLVYGATGSKKTRCIVMPSIRILGFAGESIIVNDPKGELYRTTSRFLKERGYNVITLNFREPTMGDCWNFLEIPYRFYKEGNIDKACEFVEDVANTITGDAGTNDPFWRNSAASCFYGLTLTLFRYCKEYGKPDDAVNIANLLILRQKMFRSGKNKEFWQWAREDELIAASLIGTIETATDTKNGILSTLDQCLRCFSVSPALTEMVSHNTFDMNSIAQQKTAVFLITPDEKTTYHRLVALYISQSYQQLVQLADHSGGTLPGRVNYILDEFSSLPMIGGCDMAQYLSAGRSRRLRFLLCLQSKNQLLQTYEKNAQTIVANCTNWIFLFSREIELLREISELCGEKRDKTPNLSVYDLQQLDKDHNQALLLSARRKPAVVNLLDIGGYGPSYPELKIQTPVRKKRVRLDFAEFEVPQMNQINPFEKPPFLMNADQQQKMEHLDMNLDEMLKDIDAKIAALDAAEAKEKEQKAAEQASAADVGHTESEE